MNNYPINSGRRNDLGQYSIVHSNVYATNDDVNISSIYYTQTHISEVRIEPAEKKAILHCNVTTRIIYRDVDGIVGSMSCNSTLSDMIDNAIITSSSKILISDTSVSDDVLLSGRDLNISSNITFAICVYNTDTINALTECDEHITKVEKMRTMCVSDKIRSTFPCMCDMTIRDKAYKILHTQMRLVVEDIMPLDGYISITGKIIAECIYEIERDGICEVKYITDMCSIKNEITAEGVTIESKLDIHAYIDCSSLNVNTDITEDSTLVTLEASICVSGYALNEVEQKYISDSYSTIDQLSVKHTLCDNTYSYRINGGIEDINAEISMNAADEIICLTNMSATCTQSTVSGQKWYIDMLVEGIVVYRDESGNIMNTPFVTPHQIQCDIDDNVDPYHISAHLQIDQLRYKIKRADLASYDCSIIYYGTAYATHTQNIVTEITKGEHIEYSDISYQIYIAYPNEDLWSLCKRLHVSMETLNMCNSELPSIMNGGERILINR